MNLKHCPDVLTVKDVASILKIGQNSAYNLLKNGDIRSHKIGKIYRVPKICLQEYLKWIFSKDSIISSLHNREDWKIEINTDV